MLTATQTELRSYASNVAADDITLLCPHRQADFSIERLIMLPYTP